MAFLFGGAGGGGGMFGLGGGSAPSYQIVGINTSLLTASYNAQITRQSLSSLSAEDRASFSSFNSEPAVIAPWQKQEQTQSLNQRVRDVRNITKFIDLNDKDVKAAGGNVDREASFAVFKALDRLRTLAEYAGEASTIKSSLGRLDTQFQQGFEEVKDYLAEVEFNKMNLFLGSKEYKTETATRLGKNQSDFQGSFNTTDPNAVIAEISGTEVFDVNMTKSGVTDTFTIDLSQMSTSYTLNNIKDYINSQIETVLVTDEFGDPVLDSEGLTQSKYLSRFDVGQNTTSSKYGLQLDGLETETVALSAQASDPAIYVASTVEQLDDSFALTSRITEFSDIDGTLTVDNTTSFAATDLEASEIKLLTKDKEEETLDPALAAMRDKMLADAVADTTDPDATTTDEEDDEDPEANSITNIFSDTKVNADTQSNAIAVDSEGNMYVVGQSTGSFDHQINNAESTDAYVSKFDSEGNLIFSRLLGIEGEASGVAITLDSQDNVIIAGQTDSPIATGDVLSGTDAFVMKLSKRGDEVFRYQLDKASDSSGLSVTVDGNDDVIVAGATKGGISATSGYGGGGDGLVLKLDGTSGALTGSAVIGGANAELVKGVAVASDGNILIAMEDGDNAILKKLDASDLSNEMFSIDLGTLGTTGSISSIAVEGTQVVIAGVTTNGISLDAGGTATVNGAAISAQDGFVASFTDGGASVTADYVTYLATAGTDRVEDLTLANGKVYLAGTTTDSFAGETEFGSMSAFVTRLDGATGVIENQEQFGENVAKSHVGGIAFTTKGNSILSVLGLPNGTLEADQTRDITTQTSARVGDHFFISVDGGAKRKIDIDEGDTFDDMARKIRIAAFSKMNVDVAATEEGDKLKLSAFDKVGSPVIELMSGKDDQDALKRLGLEPGRLLPRDEVLGIDTDEDALPEDDVGGVFGLGLEGALHIKDKTTAQYVLGLLDTAIGTVQRANRSLTYNPLKALLKQNAANANTAPPPAYMTARINNYQDALYRLQGMNQSGPSSFFI